jgi:hypothetical protein
MTQGNPRIHAAAFTPVDQYVMTRRTTTDDSIQWAVDVGKVKPPPPRPQRPAPPPRRARRRR